MLIEIVKPVALLLCILSLYAVFHTAFLIPASDLQQKIWDSLRLLALAGGIAMVSGLIFSETEAGTSHHTRFLATLPMQVFCWGTGAFFVLFILSWYLEGYPSFYLDMPLRHLGALLRR